MHSRRASSRPRHRTSDHGAPDDVKAIEISAPGGPDVLRLTERQLPAVAAGEMLIRVAASGVNRPDVLQRKGLYPVPHGASDLPGLEVAGVIEAQIWNHTFFWSCMKPSGGGEPTGALATAINARFGSYAAFKEGRLCEVSSRQLRFWLDLAGQKGGRHGGHRQYRTCWNTTDDR